MALTSRLHHASTTRKGGGSKDNSGTEGKIALSTWNIIKFALCVVILISILGRLNVLHSVSDGEGGLPNMMMVALTNHKGPLAPYKSPVVRPNLPSIRGSWMPFENIKVLPGFAWNNTQFMLGSTLTRDDRLNSLFIDMHFMGVKAVQSSGTTYGKIKGDADWDLAVLNMIQDVREKYDSQQAQYKCIFNLPYETKYDGKAVQGQAVPTATTVDGNVNDMTNVLRCELPLEIRDFVLQYKCGELQVQLSEQILSQGLPPVSMINFTIPISERTTGYLQYTPPPSPSGSYDPWSPTQNLHMCAPGLRSAFTTPLAEMVVEFLEYHFMQGVDFVFLGLDYDRDSKDWQRAQVVLEQYIKEGKVAISSTKEVTTSHIDSELKKVYFYNQCLYHSKGSATWVGIWDADELLTPRSPGKDITGLIDKYGNPESNGGKETCFIQVTSYSHALPKEEAIALEKNKSVLLPLDWSADKIHYMGERFAWTRESGHDDAYAKCILSTRNVYFTGFHIPGACAANGHDWTKLVRSDDTEWETYAKLVPKQEAAVFHFRNVLMPISYVRSYVWEPSEYSLYYFNEVKSRIRERGLEELLIALKKSI